MSCQNMSCIIATPTQLTTVRESLSRKIYLRPRSQASCTPSSTALASIASTPKGSSTRLLIDPINCPLSFLITTSMPQPPTSLNTAPLVLTLYHPCCEGGHGCEATRTALIGV
ncbi:hypothetical protein ACB092_09G142800 [Castanea dentata]